MQSDLDHRRLIVSSQEPLQRLYEVAVEVVRSGEGDMAPTEEVVDELAAAVAAVEHAGKKGVTH